jgi:peptide deformylase
MSPHDDPQRGDKKGSAPLEALRTFGDPALKQPTRPVTVFDARLEKLAQTMMRVMDREEGVGLAAPQIGVLSRVMVWRDPDDEKVRYVFVNPFIVAQSEECTTASEGCLSVPGATVEVTRANEITVTSQDLKGVERTWELSGMLARIVQHEIDHLEGRLIVDRASPEERKRVLKELRERTLSGRS